MGVPESVHAPAPLQTRRRDTTNEAQPCIAITCTQNLFACIPYTALASVAPPPPKRAKEPKETLANRIHRTRTGQPWPRRARPLVGSETCDVKTHISPPDTHLALASWIRPASTHDATPTASQPSPESPHAAVYKTPHGLNEHPTPMHIHRPRGNGATASHSDTPCPTLTIKIDRPPSLHLQDSSTSSTSKKTVVYANTPD